MGAYMLAATLIAPANFTPDWEAGLQAVRDLDVSTIPPSALDNIYEEYEYDGLTDQDQWDPRITLETKILDVLKENLYGRDVTSHAYGDVWIFIAGGMSWGDAPEVTREMWTLQKFPTVMKAIGFLDADDITFKSKEA